jgi:hypothetical protein
VSVDTLKKVPSMTQVWILNPVSVDKCDDKIADTTHDHEDDCLVLAVVLTSVII